MQSVHGISVSGPTFPATIWKLFMERAVDYAPYPTEFPTPTTSPVWRTPSLKWAMSSGSSSYDSSSSSGYSDQSPQP
jgi:hypothetical protein